MEPEPYASDVRLFYPGAGLTQDERDKMDRYEIPIDQVTFDHLVYSMSRQIENNFQSFYTIAEEVVGEEKALEIAREIGRRYGGGGYATFLKANGRDGRRQPADDGAVPGPRAQPPRAQARVGAVRQHDESRCVVKRGECIYFSERAPQNGKYTEAFESGCFEGYCAADRNLLRVEVKHCRWKGTPGCEQHWVYRDDEDAPTS